MQCKIDPENKSTFKYNPEVGRVINNFSIDRIKKAIETSGGEILIGGIETIDRDQSYVCPTIILNPDLNS
jgi:acyl-CoA reductase-like NAD-dependent aldehyde dehydrogenase